jgi:hypothetical protein
VTAQEFIITSGSAFPKRSGFKNFTWTDNAIREWDTVWSALWRIGVKWEWQNSDRYARCNGKTYTRFAVYNDADRLAGTVPLPGHNAILAMHDYLLDLPTDDFRVDHATNLIRKWIKNYVE